MFLVRLEVGLEHAEQAVDLARKSLDAVLKLVRAILVIEAEVLDLNRQPSRRPEQPIDRLLSHRNILDWKQLLVLLCQVEQDCATLPNVLPLLARGTPMRIEDDWDLLVGVNMAEVMA